MTPQHSRTFPEPFLNRSWNLPPHHSKADLRYNGFERTLFQSVISKRTFLATILTSCSKPHNNNSRAVNKHSGQDAIVNDTEPPSDRDPASRG